MGQLMSDALSYATAAPGVTASRYGRSLRQRDFNNASEISLSSKRRLPPELPSEQGKPHALPARCIHNPQLSSRYSSTDRLPKHISCGPVQRLSTTEF
jgi:hypothetical protein